MPVWVRTIAVATALATAGVLVAAPAAASLPKHAKQVTVRAGHTVSHVDASLTAGSAIAGQVTDNDTNPLSGATVEVLTAAGQVLDYTSTDSSGDFRAVSLPPSTKGYAVCVYGANATSTVLPVSYGYVSQCNGSAEPWSYNSKPTSDARLIPTVVGQASTANLILPEAGAITGKVTSRATGLGVDATGSLYSKSGRQEGGLYASGGVYTTSGVAPGTYKVCFSPASAPKKGHPGLLQQCYHDTPWPPDSPPPSAATTVTVTSGAATEVDQSLPAAAAVSGKVRNAKTHSATAAAVVVVFAHNKTLAIQLPDRHGTFEIQNLPLETVDVCAFPVMHQMLLRATRAGRRAGHPAASMWTKKLVVDSAKAAANGQCWKNTPWSGKGSVPRAARELHLHRGATTSGIDLAVTPTTFRSHITGHVRDAAGGLKHAAVSAFLPSGSPVAFATSGKGGAYRLSLPASAKKGYIVCAGSASGVVLRADVRHDPAQPVLGSACWRKVAWNGASRPPTDAPKVKVASGHTTGGIDITLPKAGAIAGSATYQTAPVPNLSVYAFDTHGDFLGFGRTDADGRYKVTGLSPAKGYVVCFGTEGVDVSTVAPDYGLRSQCYSGQAWDGFND